MSHEELKTLQRSIKKLISINSFFSTSIDYYKALDFLNNSDISNDFHRVLFVIDAHPHVVSNKPFADVSSHSHYNEREVLFMVGCVSIYIKKNVCLFVCLFFMHLVPVRARVTKLSMAYP